MIRLIINQEIQGDLIEESDLTPIPGSSTGTGTFEAFAYYENPGILMIVQSVEDEGYTWNKGDFFLIC